MWLWMLGLGMTLPATPDDLCALADVVLVGEVTSQEREWVPHSDGHIRTRSWLAVSQVLRGPEADTAEVITAGGDLGGVQMRVEDEASLRMDHRYVLLLGWTDAGWRVVGGAQGAWPLRHGAPVDVPEACRAR
jgi:hypothetical protein